MKKLDNESELSVNQRALKNFIEKDLNLRVYSFKVGIDMILVELNHVTSDDCHALMYNTFCPFEGVSGSVVKNRITFYFLKK